MTAPEPQAFQNRVLLRQLGEDEVSDYFPGSALVVPETLKYKQTYRQWVIEDIGPDCDPDLLLCEGLRVIIQPKVGSEFVHNEQRFLTVYDHQIVAVFG